MNRLFAVLSGISEASLYIHIPFCRVKCGYCSFFSVPSDQAGTEHYIEALGDILAQLPDFKVPTVYVGGGDPGILSFNQMKHLLIALERFSRSAGEFTIELNPEGITQELLKLFADYGISRISLGIQSFDEKLRSAIGRTGTVSAVDRSLELLKKTGQFAVNTDLITGIPGAGKDQSVRDIELLFSRFIPEHISLYELSLEETAQISSKLNELEEDTLSPAWEYLKDAGYRHYELSNFCLSGYESLHNSRYWKLKPYIGIGPSAVSNLPMGDVFLRSTFAKDIEQFIRYGMESVSEEIIDGHTCLNELIMVSLRTEEGIPVELIDRVFGSNAAQIVTDICRFWKAGGYMKGSALTEKGMLIMNRIIIDFFRQLDAAAPIYLREALDTVF